MAVEVLLIAVIVAVAGWLGLHWSSPLVRTWRPSAFKRHTAGPLSVLDSGPPEIESNEVVLLLHGLGATGDYFGDSYDGLSHRRRVVVVDLLGFGHSLDEQRTDFSVDAHVEALSTACDALDLGDRDMVVAAHSMAAAIALTWANANPERCGQVVVWGPPIYPDKAAARQVGKQYGLMARLFLMDTAWAERACRLSCRNRTLSGWAMALMAPRWPIEISRNASQHTWAAYHDSLAALVLEFDWSTAFPARTPVTLIRGADDPIGDAAAIARLTADDTLIEVPGAGHHVALTHRHLLYDALDPR